MRVGGLVEPHIVFGAGGERPLYAYLVFFLGFRKQCAGPLGGLLERAAHKPRLELAVGPRGRLGFREPCELRFRHVGVVREHGL